MSVLGPFVELHSIMVNVNIPGRQPWRHRFDFAWRILIGLPIHITLPDASVTVTATPHRCDRLHIGDDE